MLFRSELDGLGAEELPHMTRRIQQLIDAAAQRHEAGASAESPSPRRDHGATSRTPTTGKTRARREKESAASRSRTRISIERDAEGHPRAVEWRGNPPPPRPRGERYPTPPPVAHPTLSGRLGRREGVGENDARHRIDRLARSLALEEEDDVGPPCFGPRIRDEPFPKGFSLPRDTPKYNGSVKPEELLIDYSTAISIANGNTRIAVKYVPLMLQGTAHTWLNSLKPYSVNSWLDFTEVFEIGRAHV